MGVGSGDWSVNGAALTAASVRAIGALSEDDAAEPGEVPTPVCGLALWEFVLSFSLFFLGFSTCSRSIDIFTTFFFGVIFTLSTALLGSSYCNAPRKCSA